MNTDALQRVTFVLDRATADRLATIAARLGVSRSSLARDVLGEPVELMHRWIAALPLDPSPEEAAAALDAVAADMGEWLDSKAAQLDLLTGPTDGTA